MGDKINDICNKMRVYLKNICHRMRVVVVLGIHWLLFTPIVPLFEAFATTPTLEITFTFQEKTTALYLTMFIFL